MLDYNVFVSEFELTYRNYVYIWTKIFGIAQNSNMFSH